MKRVKDFTSTRNVIEIPQPIQVVVLQLESISKPLDIRIRTQTLHKRINAAIDILVHSWSPKCLKNNTHSSNFSTKLISNVQINPIVHTKLHIVTKQLREQLKTLNKSVNIPQYRKAVREIERANSMEEYANVMNSKVFVEIVHELILNEFESEIRDGNDKLEPFSIVILNRNLIENQNCDWFHMLSRNVAFIDTGMTTNIKCMNETKSDFQKYLSGNLITQSFDENLEGLVSILVRNVLRNVIIPEDMKCIDMLENVKELSLNVMHVESIWNVIFLVDSIMNEIEKIREWIREYELIEYGEFGKDIQSAIQNVISYRKSRNSSLIELNQMNQVIWNQIQTVNSSIHDHFLNVLKNQTQLELILNQFHSDDAEYSA
eukprot:CAMPEP_0182444956 /NCGR_PEP_ID=MMETSP1172-20130603/3245_1 /TAXON_ID=708627 /ORGANISM="Timspurckia oligopyrenoides, Strain CCMP3278" /LENGTH=375 /DNA_ID=CAMNT_0024640633 /DNA_START=1183 /DNA_END=2306 /DNA_ORIENTATION=-